MSAGWFFVVASEAITVSNQRILLPGIGSYIAVAIQAANLRAISYAVLMMFFVILIYDQLLFRPLVAWSEKFKSEQISTEKIAESWVVDLFRRTRLFRIIGSEIASLFDTFVNIKIFRAQEKILVSSKWHAYGERFFSFLWGALLICVIAIAIKFLISYILRYLSFAAVEHVFLLGLITAIRVFIMIVLCSFIWVPIGVWIGLRPKVAQVIQPIAQFLAAFPANLLYPFIVLFIVRFHLNTNIWLTPLMILGAQWYILFNVIAGASTVPKDLLQVTDNFGVTGWLRWRRLLLPAIFPYYITGAITAAGGAWNASIVAEVASWGDKKLVATGLGAYISEYTIAGSFPHIALGIGMMCILVFIFNRLVWKQLYVYAETRFLLE
jgi:NitT/TauT family transport system permease protein